MVIKSVFLAVQTNFSLYKPISRCTNQFLAVQTNFSLYKPISRCTNQLKKVLLITLNAYIICLHNQVDFIFSYIVIFFLPRWLDVYIHFIYIFILILFLSQHRITRFGILLYVKFTLN